MPAVMIRQLDALTRVAEHTRVAEQRDVLVRQAAMILRSSRESVCEPADFADIRSRYETFISIAGVERSHQEPSDLHLVSLVALDDDG